MIDDEYTMQLSEYCFHVCGTLKGALQGKNPGDLSEFEKMATWNLERCIGQPLPLPFVTLKCSRAMRGIECTLRRGVESTPYPEYNKKKIERYVQDIRQILGTVQAPRPSLVENSADECIITPASETGMSSSVLSYPLSDPDWSLILLC